MAEQAEQPEEQGKAEFLPLWPTLFMSVILPGHESANGVLSTIVMQDNAEQEQMTTNYLEQNFFASDHPAIGWLVQALPPTGLVNWRLFLVTGLLGGFTTFSAFSIETLGLVQAGYLARAGLNVISTLALCFTAVWVGWNLSRWLHVAS